MYVSKVKETLKMLEYVFTETPMFEGPGQFKQMFISPPVQAFSHLNIRASCWHSTPFVAWCVYDFSRVLHLRTSSPPSTFLPQLSLKKKKLQTRPLWLKCCHSCLVPSKEQRHPEIDDLKSLWWDAGNKSVLITSFIIHSFHVHPESFY